MESNYLRKFSRNLDTGKKTKKLTTRMTKYSYDLFKAHCDKYGLSMSEAVSILIDRELGGIEDQKTTKESQQEAQKEVTERQIAVTSDDTDSQMEVKPTMNVRPRKTKSPGGGRFVTTEWQVDNMLPCPICDKWYNHSNFSRHTQKSHSRTTKEIFTEYKEKVDEMVKEKTES